MLIYDLTYEKLEQFLVDNGFKKYRTEQIWQWLYVHKIDDFDEMLNIPNDLKEIIKENFTLKSLVKVVQSVSQDGTVKILYGLHDKHLIETVLMENPYGNSVCVTTQVGCNIGCSFCASGIIRKQRDLSNGEIIEQIIQTEKLSGKKINYVVVMGIGEPFDNYNHLKDFLFTINHPKGLAIGARKITVSTSGLAHKIKEFAHLGIQVNLAISLHAPNDEIRSKLMKINNTFSIDNVLEAVKYYLSVTKRRVTFEYILIDGVNDSVENAKELARKIRGLNAYVNLIPYNEVFEVEYKRSTKENQLKFYDALKRENIQVTLRKEQGHDINAACGQLRSSHESKKGESVWKKQE